jgi:hypothetical protein
MLAKLFEGFVLNCISTGRNLRLIFIVLCVSYGTRIQVSGCSLQKSMVFLKNSAHTLQNRVNRQLILKNKVYVT